MSTEQNWTKPKTTAVVLAAGSQASRDLLKSELSENTVAQQALGTLRKVIPAEDIVVVTAKGDMQMRPPYVIGR